MAEQYPVYVNVLGLALVDRPATPQESAIAWMIGVSFFVWFVVMIVAYVIMCREEDGVDQ